MFNSSDLAQIEAHQLDVEVLNYQIQKFKSGFAPSFLAASATQENGIRHLSDQEAEALIEFYEAHLKGLNIVKFVPASGAATRMFKTLYSFLLEYDGSEEAYQKMISDQGSGSIYTFFKNLEQFAFYGDLKAAFQAAYGMSLEEAQLKREYKKILETLLEPTGLDYGSLPKGLLKFHQYGEVARTPVEEHMEEGAQYAKDADGKVKIHFTVSPDHLSKFQAHVSQVRSVYEAKYGVSIEISYSVQKPSTDTIAVDLDNNPFRNQDGSLLFRPAGHGALLENFNEIDADVIFLKNIDNVVPDKIKDTTVIYKKAIAGLLLQAATEVEMALKNLDQPDGVEQAKLLLANKLGYQTAPDFDALSENEKRAHLREKLDRPLRVCGMVKNDGDTGGGPFWIKAPDGSVSLQVVETAQIDLKNPDQKSIFSSSTHFNPVDLVCKIKDHQGKKYDLLQFRDPEAGFITQKSKDGKDLKAQELPGLWNGSMANWNTLFVEVPLITFNPVKSVNDLLLPEHQS